MRVVYYINRWARNPIIRAEVVKETKCYLWHGSNPKRLERLDKTAAYDTFKEAKAALVESAESALDAAKRRVTEAERKLERVHALAPEVVER